MPTRVFLIRHGATELSAEDRFAGSAEIPISTEGERQARALAGRLASQRIDAIYASPKLRTMQTARILAGPHDLDVTPVPGVEEMSHGRWEGLSRAEVERRFPEEYAQWDNDPFHFAPIGGETGLAVTARAIPALLELARHHDGAQIIVVSHKATIRLILSLLLGFDARTYRDRLDQAPCALNVLDFRDPTRARLALYNDISHYAEDPSRIPPPPAGRLSKWFDGGSDPGADSSAAAPRSRS
jgi:broad specificity phosphatase PhoE